ncbi:hypothetical protein C0J52_25796 [Blattella germanica]|nr:hypothetical protein C0J52_25796 [Blattella germanica]
MARNKVGENWVAGRLLVNTSRTRPDPPHGLMCRTLSDSQVRLDCKEPPKFANNITAYTIHYFPAVPLAAPQLTLKAISPTSLRVSWEPLSKKKAQGIVTEYKIQWRRKTQPTIRVEQVKGDMTDYTITELHPGKRYEVRVLAATSKGWPSQQDEFEWTDEETPVSPQNVPQAPTVHLTVVNSSSIEKFGPISLTANTTQFLLGDLDPDSWYEVLVHGYNDEGVGEFGLKAIYTLPTSGNADVTAIPSMGLEPPTNLEAEPTSPNSINLTWTPPQSAVNVSYYTVCYGQVQSTFTVNSTFVSSTSQGVEVSYLKPYTLYEFKVRTHDHNNQHGPYSQKVECATLEDVPSAVLGVQWRVLNSSTIHVTWKEPQHTNGVIKYYEIMFDRDSGGSADHVRSLNVSNSKLSTEVTNLDPNRRYFMSVRAVTRAGSGPPSDKVIVTIPVVIPNPVSTPQPPAPGIQTDQHLGIVVGVVIAGGCIILCAIIIVWRRHCIKSASPECSAGGGTSCGSVGHHANGNGYYREWDRSPASQPHITATVAPTEIHEMDYFSTNNIPCDTHADHLDTKGGYPNGQVNGLKHPLLTNGRIPNGQALRDRNSVRIIENPQFNRGDAGDQRHIVVIPVTKSRSSHLHGDRRSGTGTEEEVQLLADHNTPLLSLRGGNETPLQPQAGHGLPENNHGSSRDRPRSDDASMEENDLDVTQVTSLDLNLDDSGGDGGDRSSHQHSPHHHNHHHHQPHPSNSSHDSHNQGGGGTSLHHIDNITGTSTTTRSQFHSPLLNQAPSGPHDELFRTQAAAMAPRNDLLLNQ